MQQGPQTWSFRGFGLVDYPQLVGLLVEVIYWCVTAVGTDESWVPKIVRLFDVLSYVIQQIYFFNTGRRIKSIVDKYCYLMIVIALIVAMDNTILLSVCRISKRSSFSKLETETSFMWPISSRRGRKWFPTVACLLLFCLLFFFYNRSSSLFRHLCIPNLLSRVLAVFACFSFSRCARCARCVVNPPSLLVPLCNPQVAVVFYLY